MALFDEDSTHEHIKKLEDSLGVPQGFFDDLLAEHDWSFVIKGHAFLEAFCAHLLTERLDARLEDVFGNMALGGGRTGKLAFIEALDLLDEASLRFSRRFSTLRNALVHRVENVEFAFETYLRGLSPQERQNFVREVTAPFPDYAPMLLADDGLLAERHLKMVIHMSLLAAATEGYFRLHPDRGNLVAERAMLDAVLGALLLTFEEIAKREHEQ